MELHVLSILIAEYVESRKVMWFLLSSKIPFFNSAASLQVIHGKIILAVNSTLLSSKTISNNPSEKSGSLYISERFWPHEMNPRESIYVMNLLIWLDSLG